MDGAFEMCATDAYPGKLAPKSKTGEATACPSVRGGQQVSGGLPEEGFAATRGEGVEVAPGKNQHSFMY